MSTRALLPAAVLAGLAILFSPRVTREMPDFGVYWRAAARARAAAPLYRAEDGHYQFKYLPGFAVLAMPLAALPLQQAKTIWFVTSAALLGLLLAATVKLLPERRKPAWALWLLTMVALGKFYGHEFVLGQVNLLFALLVSGGLLAIRHGREATAGLFVALAIVVKPYAIILLPWLLARRSPPAVAAAMLGLAGALALPATVYGIEQTAALHGEWWQTASGSTAPNLLNQDNVSLAAMFAKWLGAGETAAMLAAVGSAILLAVAVLVFVKRGGVPFPEGLEAGLLLTLVPLISPQGWDYVLLVSTPAVVWLLNYEDRLPSTLRVLTFATLAVIGLSLFDLMGRARYAQFMALSAITCCVLLVVALLVTLRLRRIA